MKFSRVLSFAVLLASFARQAAGQNPTASSIDSVFAAYDGNDAPGCAAAALKGGVIDYARGFGLSDLERREKITDRTVFNVASMSKQFTAGAITLLVHAGSLSLDDDIRKFLPELRSYPAAAGRTITIRMLLSQTSGLRDYTTLLDLAGLGSARVTVGQELEMLYRQRDLNFRPNTEFAYSNSNYLLLSRIIEIVAKKPFAQVLQDSLFIPLGMMSTFVDRSDSSVSANALRIATRYTASPKSAGFTVSDPQWDVLGDGGINTTVSDLVKWDENFYTGKVGGRNFGDEMQASASLDNGASAAYARGLFVDDYSGLRMINHSGSADGVRTDMLRFPDQHISVAVLCNRSDAPAMALTRQVANKYVSAFMHEDVRVDPRPAQRVTEQDMRAWVGTYRNLATGTTRTVSLVDGQLTAGFGQASQPLEPKTATIYTVTAGRTVLELRFEGTPGGTRRMRQFLSGREAAVFEEVAADRLPAEALRAYEGSFSTDELPLASSVKLNASGLVITLGDFESPMQPLGKDRFAVTNLIVQFRRNVTTGAVDAFSLDASRAKGILFARK